MSDNGSSPDEPNRPGAGASAVGPLAVEAALLLDVVADRLTALKPGSDDPGRTATTAGSGGPDTAGDPPGTTASGRPPGPDGRCPECGSIPGASCTACPLCRFLAMLRGERPETTAKLVDGALLIVRALRSMIPEAPATPESAGPATGPRGAGDPPPAPTSPPPARRGGFERIDIL